MLPDLDVAAAKTFCEQRVPPDARDQLRVEAQVEPTAVTIVERRAPWHEDFGPEWSTVDMARLRFAAKSGLWTLYSCDGKGRWQKYDVIGPSSHIATLLDEIDRDPTGIFWG